MHSQQRHAHGQRTRAACPQGTRSAYYPHRVPAHPHAHPYAHKHARAHAHAHAQPTRTAAHAHTQHRHLARTPNTDTDTSRWTQMSTHAHVHARLQRPARFFQHRGLSLSPPPCVKKKKSKAGRDQHLGTSPRDKHFGTTGQHHGTAPRDTHDTGTRTWDLMNHTTHVNRLAISSCHRDISPARSRAAWVCKLTFCAMNPGWWKDGFCPPGPRRSRAQ